MALLLYVDDDPAAIAAKRVVLERAGHQVTTCASVEAAIELLNANHFDAIITDWRLGERRGREIISAAKLISEVPIVVVSGFVSEAFHAGDPAPDLYLQKPVDPEELVRSLEALLGNRHPRIQERDPEPHSDS